MLSFCEKALRCVLTFIYVGWEASDKDLPGVALHPLSILTASGGVQARSQGRVNMGVIEETILKRKQTGATWEEGWKNAEKGGEKRDEKGKQTLRKEPESCDRFDFTSAHPSGIIGMLIRRERTFSRGKLL